MSDPVLRLDGTALTVEDLHRASHRVPRIDLDPDALRAMAASHALVQQAIREKVAVYGVTTGLGARSTEVLDTDALSEFSVQTLRGRAHAIGPEEQREVIRAGMIVRLNTLLCGHSGARPELAQHLADCLEADLTPVCGQIGSIGAADLVLNATVGLALIGEGEMRQANGEVSSSAELMRAHGIEPFVLAPREGLALANHTGSVAGAAALALYEAQTAFEAAQTAVALSMVGFRANLGPLDPTILAVKPHPGQISVAAGLSHRLDGSALMDPAQARRLQDPLCFRNVVQIHGTTQTALTQAIECLRIEINSASDNPVALVDSRKIISSGAFFTSEVTSVIETLNRSIVPLVFAQLARISKLLNPVFSDLPSFLAKPNSASNGFAPIMKPAEALASEIAHQAQPVPIWPSLNANGVEDCMTGSPTAVKALRQIIDRLRRLTAIELMVAGQAVDLHGVNGALSPALIDVLTNLRKISEPLGADRPLGLDIETIAEAIGENGFAGGVMSRG
ncbi:aromatic amino acid lyase (plasmid) [Aliisedimentitalea scapharcae]|uniref:Aromatic amino acid lyase n=1 Tax=Aliisedimentitalea scapharcae TaxID=1524259 RepID=A0ABZ2XZ55_9RHOB